jgi:hypothetical protein
MIKTKLNNFAYGIFALSVCLLVFVPGGHVAAATTSPHQYVTDVTGDGLGDAITFDSHAGDWWVAPSNGSNAFGNPSRWISGFGIGSSKQLLADVTGDGKADVVTFDINTGDWWVAPSSGSSFTTPSRWVHGHGVGSSNQFLADISGDGKADAVLFFNTVPGVCQTFVCSGSWWAATSNLAGNKFDTPGEWFSGGHGVGSSNQFLADVDGDGKADAIVWNSTTSDWYVASSNAVHFNGPNLWAHAVGIGATSEFISDLDADGKSDLILSFGWTPSKNINSNWYGVKSNGSSFDTTILLAGWGFGISNVMFDNVFTTPNTDMVLYDPVHGDWRVLPGGGNIQYFFEGGSRWISGFGVGT